MTLNLLKSNFDQKELSSSEPDV